MVNQAEKIRELALDLLKNSKEKDYISKDFYGIRYSDLKLKILNNKKDYTFTDGAVTGALYTLTERVPNVYKIKVKGGTFFYYSDSKEDNLNVELLSITVSSEYKELLDLTKKTEAKIKEILNKAGQKKYKKTTELDTMHLRKALQLTNDLNNALNAYEIEKSFEQIDDLDEFKLPF